MEAFNDTVLFDDMLDHDNVENKLIFSPFVCDFPIGSGLEEVENPPLPTPKSTKDDRVPKSPKPERGSTIHISVVDEFMAQIKQ